MSDGRLCCVGANDRRVDVADLAAVMAWPGFRDTAWQLGLRASLSIPLFAASGAPIAALNLYAHDSEPMAALTRQVWPPPHRPARCAPRSRSAGADSTGRRREIATAITDECKSRTLTAELENLTQTREIRLDGERP